MSDERSPDSSLSDLGTAELLAAMSSLDTEPVATPSGQLTATASRFVEESELGRGAMGRVALARDTDLDRPVAIKQLLPELQGDAALQERFLHEARVLGRLQHPAIVPIYELGRTEGGAPFFVMRRLEGETLLDVLKALARGDADAAERWPLRRLLGAFVRLCQAVEYTHQAGYVHRDLKPANVVLGRFGEVTLVDWGLADEAHLRQVRDPKADAGLPGTPDYIAPERLGEEPFDPFLADAWSLGVVLYEVLTLLKPHPGRRADALLQQARLFDPDPPSQVAPLRGIAEELDEICLDAMARDPAERLSTGELVRDLEEFLEGDRRRERERREADDLLETAAAQAERWRSLCRRVAALDGQAHALRAGLRPWSPLADKRLLWGIEDQLAALGHERDQAFGRATRAVRGALERVRDDARARKVLADLWWARMEDAEARGDEAQADLSRDQVRTWGDAERVARLGAGGELTLTTEPPGAEVWTMPMEQADRLHVPGEGQRLGSTPFSAAVPAGSQLLSVELPGRAPLRVPLLVGRGAEESLTLELPAADAAPEGMVPVPGGPFLHAVDGGPPARIPLGGFWIAVFPTTFGDWLRYLQAVGFAPERLPRLASGAELIDGAGEPRLDALFSGVPEAERPRGIAWRRLPVVGVTVPQVEAYCAFRSEVRPVRLPTEAEWEKAGRGADGRAFPCGDAADLSFANWRGGRPGAPRPLPIGTVGMDASVYGVRDLAGGVAEWCAGGDPGLSPVRGVGWDGRPRQGFADRELRASDSPSTAIGFRLAADWG